MHMKACTKCGEVKPLCLGHFYRQPSVSTGLGSLCKPCDRDRCRANKRQARLEGKIKKPTPEKSKEYMLRYKAKDPNRFARLARENQERRRIDPSYRLMSNMGRRVRDMIKGKSGSTRHLPYSSDEIISHLEKQFLSGMTWSNYGTYWHIDHIVPVSSFEADSPESEDFKSCWALSNLRPLPAFDNQSKHSKREYLI